MVANESEAALGEEARLLRVVSSLTGFHFGGGRFGGADDAAKDTGKGV